MLTLNRVWNRCFPLLYARKWRDSEAVVQAVVATAMCVGLPLYLSFFVLRGWIAPDEGLIGQLSERVLEGQLPHRDFCDPYTGGLAYFHALAFRILGTNIAASRWVLFGASVFLAPAIYWIVSRIATPSCAAIITVACVAWSIPNYFAALPSWYMLLLIFFGIACLMHFADSNRLWALMLAGGCGGLAILMKITGLYYVAGSLLFLALHEQEQSCKTSASDRPRSPGMLVFTSLCTIAFGYVVVRLLWPKMEMSVFVHYVVPIGSVCGFLIWNEWRRGRGRFWSRAWRLGTYGLLFLAGVAVPVLLFLAPYAWQGELQAVWQGVFNLPMRRIEHNSFPLPPAIMSLVGLLPFILCRMAPDFGQTGSTGKRTGAWFRWSLWAGSLVALLLMANFTIIRVLLIESIRWLLPWLAIAAVVRMMRTGSDEESSRGRQWMFLFTALASVYSLSQFPFHLFVYFFYCAPLVIVAFCFVMTRAKAKAPSVALYAVVAFYAAFGVWHLNRGHLGGVTAALDHRLEVPRGGIRIDEGSARMYAELYRLIQSHSSKGSAIYASPDCPEIYFLNERRNPTPDFYEFFNEHPLSTEKLLKLLDDQKIEVVVVNWGQGTCSGPMPRERVAAIAKRFKQRAEVGKFDVFWRDLPDAEQVAVSKR